MVLSCMLHLTYFHSTPANSRAALPSSGGLRVLLAVRLYALADLSERARNVRAYSTATAPCPCGVGGLLHLLCSGGLQRSMSLSGLQRAVHARKVCCAVHVLSGLLRRARTSSSISLFVLSSRYLEP